MKLEMHFEKSHQLTKSPQSKTGETCGPQCEPGPLGPSPKAYREVETFGPADKTGKSAHTTDEKEIDEVSRWNKEAPQGDTPEAQKDIDAVTRFNEESTQGDTPEAQMDIDAVTRFNKEPTQGDTPEAQMDIDAVTRFNKEPTQGGSQQAMKEIDEVTSFRTQNCKCGTGNEMVTCPMCSSEVHGEDDQDLSNNLARHLREAHQVEKNEYPPDAEPGLNPIILNKKEAVDGSYPVSYLGRKGSSIHRNNF